jgi:TolB-like protein
LPNLVVQLTGTDGNAFALIGKVAREMKRAGVREELVTQFKADCLGAESYENLLQIIMDWVVVT